MRVVVTGGSGFLGQHVVRALLAAGHAVDAPPSSMVDLFSLWWERLLLVTQPEAVIHLAKPPSDGITTMATHPGSFASTVLDLDRAVINGCRTLTPLPKLVCLGSVCSYPDTVTYPTTEDQLWAGYPEAVNAPYGVAKRMQLVLLQAWRQQIGLNGIHLIPSNLYGPGDRSGHVIPALIAKVRRALVDGRPPVVWGHPRVTRSFLYVADAADGIVRALEGYNSPAPLNLCGGGEVMMGELVERIGALLGYRGLVTFDPTQPTGHHRRNFSTANLEAALDWTPPTQLDAGLRATIEWSLQHVPLVEGA